MGWLPKQKVLVPVDFSDASWKVLPTAREFVDDPNQILVVHVLQELSPLEPGELWQTVDAAARIRHTEQALRQRLAEMGAEDVQAVAVVGDPAHEVADIAQEQKADLIVLNSHGRTGLRRLMIGSVAERILRLAPCPVLVLRQ